MQMKRSQFPTILAATLLVAVSIGQATASDHVIKFSPEDISTLKQLKQVKDLSDASAKLLLSAPVIGLLASPAPADVAVTLTTTDWAGLGAAAKGMKKIGACQMQQIVDAHLEDATSDRVPTGEAAEYFRRLDEALGQQCS